MFVRPYDSQIQIGYDIIFFFIILHQQNMYKE